MKKLKYFFVAGFLVFAISCQDKTKKPSKITGLWKLESMKVRNTTTNTWSDYHGGMDGYLLYGEKGHVALHLYEKGYENTTLRFPNFNDSIPLEALRYITKSYYYMGNYNVSEKDGIVTHYKLSHSNPAEFGLTAKRRFYFSGDTLVMEPIEKKNANLRLKWLRE